MVRAIRPALVAATLALCVTAPLGARHTGDDPPQVVTVSFGAGLNTAQPGNSANHHILPKVIKVRQGGVVNFVVAGFHWIFVYKPGVDLDDVQDFAAGLPPTAQFVNFATDRLLYMGINPAVAPAPPPAPPVSNALNRVESVSFAKKGTYLVICNVTPHFKDGMVAVVKVGDDDRDDDDHHHK